VIAAAFTSFYMFRLLILTFHGSPRYTEHEVHHVHEAPKSMLIALVALAIFSIVAGFVGIPRVLHGGDRIEHFLTPETAVAETEAGVGTEGLLMAVSIVVALSGLGVTYLFYVAKPGLPGVLAAKAHAMYSILTHKYYVDEIYNSVIVWPIFTASKEFLWKFVDILVIDGTVNGVGKAVRGSGNGLRHMQTGYVRTYAAWILLGGVAVIVWFLVKT
jgi:NADH-quinone oxidoreductase subunit L